MQHMPMIHFGARIRTRTTLDGAYVANTSNIIIEQNKFI